MEGDLFDLMRPLASRRALDRPALSLSLSLRYVCIVAVLCVMTYPLLVCHLLEPCQHLFILEASEAKDGTTRLDRLNHLHRDHTITQGQVSKD
jgi:hypothetical protein